MRILDQNLMRLLCKKIFNGQECEGDCVSKKNCTGPYRKCYSRNNGSYRLRLQDDRLQGDII